MEWDVLTSVSGYQSCLFVSRRAMARSRNYRRNGTGLSLSSLAVTAVPSEAHPHSAHRGIRNVFGFLMSATMAAPDTPEPITAPDRFLLS